MNGSPTWTPVAIGLRGGRHIVRGVPGNTYRFRVQAVTPGGMGSILQAAKTTVVPVDDFFASFTPGWSRVAAPDRYLGAVQRTTTLGATLQMRRRGTKIQLIGDRGPNLGKLRVRVDNRAWQTVDTRASSNRTRQVLWASPSLSNAAHTVLVENLATAGRPRIAIDGFAFRR